MAAANAFKSARLIYKGIDTPEDDGFLLARQQDYLSTANSYPGLLMPACKKQVEEVRKWYENCLLAVIICLPPDTSTPLKDGETDRKPIPIGTISLHPMTPFVHHRKSSIGLGLLPQYQGKGYGSEAIEWVLEWGFNRAGLHRIGIGAFGWNVRAYSLYERLGFVMEGRSREAMFFEGAWHDTVELGMLEHEWRPRWEAKKKAAAEKGIEAQELVVGASKGDI